MKTFLDWFFGRGELRVPVFVLLLLSVAAMFASLFFADGRQLAAIVLSIAFLITALVIIMWKDGGDD